MWLQEIAKLIFFMLTTSTFVLISGPAEQEVYHEQQSLVDFGK
jgi:hypothetical protein